MILQPLGDLPAVLWVAYDKGLFPDMVHTRHSLKETTHKKTSVSRSPVCASANINIYTIKFNMIARNLLAITFCFLIRIFGNNEGFHSFLQQSVRGGIKEWWDQLTFCKKSNPDLVLVIVDAPAPVDTQDVSRSNGSINCLSRFLPFSGTDKTFSPINTKKRGFCLNSFDQLSIA